MYMLLIGYKSGVSYLNQWELADSAWCFRFAELVSFYFSRLFLVVCMADREAWLGGECGWESFVFVRSTGVEN